jgi:two-component system sensor histidine kinase UhpB
VLTSLKLDFMWLVDQIRRSEPKPGVPFVNKLQSLIGLVELSIATVRRISGDLRPAVLDHLGLPAAIQWEATKFEARTGIRCRFASHLNGNDLDRDRAIAVYRILQEALTNVARHAHAGAVQIDLRQAGRRVSLRVKDNGRGITRAESRSPGSIGLLGMRERARLLGGSVTIAGIRGRGTTVTVQVRLDGSRRATTPEPDRLSRGRRARSPQVDV